MPSIAPLDHARSGRRRRLARLPAHELGHRCPGEFRDTARGLLSATDRDPVTSVAEFVTRIDEIGEKWTADDRPWFRGQDCDEPLIPRLYRRDHTYVENSMNQIFRMRS